MDTFLHNTDHHTRAQGKKKKKKKDDVTLGALYLVDFLTAL